MSENFQNYCSHLKTLLIVEPYHIFVSLSSDRFIFSTGSPLWQILFCDMMERFAACQSLYDTGWNQYRQIKGNSHGIYY